MQWSCDSSQSSYKQRFLESDVDYSFVFVLSLISYQLSLVPLQVYCTMPSDDKTS
jgi:hypothetical protein